MDADLARNLAGALAEFPEVAAAWLFGSFARGQQRPDSDLDIALVLKDRNLVAATALPLLGRLAARLELAAPGHPVDLVLIERQGPIFQHEVLLTGRLVWDADRERRVDFESDAYVRYFDFLPTYRLAEGQALEGFRRAFSGRA